MKIFEPNNINFYRYFRKLSQYDLAQRLEVSQPQVWRMEKGVVKIRSELKKKISEVLDVPESLIFGELPKDTRQENLPYNPDDHVCPYAC